MKIVRTTTDDGLWLDGLLGGAPDPARVVVLLHSAYANFYEGRFIEPIDEAFASVGWALLTVNTRGRDYFADFMRVGDPIAPEFREVGGIRESFDESFYDVKAWIDCARSMGAAQVVVAGHSLGAMKAVHAVGRRGLECDGLLLMSPADLWGYVSDLCGSKFDRFRKVGAEAFAEWDSAGRSAVPSDLMPSDAYFFPISKVSYGSLFSDPSTTGMFRLGSEDDMSAAGLGGLGVPVGISLGSEREVIAGRPTEYLQAIEKVVRNAQCTGVIVEGADHNYHGKEEALAQFWCKWLAENVVS